MTLLQIQSEHDLLAEALGDTPETAIPAHLLRCGLADAYAGRAAPPYDGVVVRSRTLLHEPWCFGSDPAAVWELLRPLNAWGRERMSPNVTADLAIPLAGLMERETGVRVQHYEDVYHTLTGAVGAFAVPEVRLLDFGDIGLLFAYRYSLPGMGFATLNDLLASGLAAGAVVEGRLVAVAYTNALTAGYGDMGVATDEAWRGRGFASAAASIVARRLQEQGRTPVWSAGEGNAASLRVAEKLGFTEVSRRVYLNTYA